MEPGDEDLQPLYLSRHLNLITRTRDAECIKTTNVGDIFGGGSLPWYIPLYLGRASQEKKKGELSEHLPDDNRAIIHRLLTIASRGDFSQFRVSVPPYLLRKNSEGASQCPLHCNLVPRSWRWRLPATTNAIKIHSPLRLPQHARSQS
jgi:hypothetical protein